ncbi:uncharacterized protein F4822DRAFT_59794 [Hypoxylon trugodes]|uniref:uncharacterized protein n=1 Tax=Hypoxylon trugodes TaxID=326681 RepID=UPI00219EB2B7|nr:uncharacterized protein F4822DRAFT_59794 [Hypoxylon trugodes]KAI1384066.1 hypothetical protein F4822DRAFT_59794 [Hypoxylon trugodes]
MIRHIIRNAQIIRQNHIPTASSLDEEILREIYISEIGAMVMANNDGFEFTKLARADTDADDEAHASEQAPFIRAEDRENEDLEAQASSAPPAYESQAPGTTETTAAAAAKEDPPTIYKFLGSIMFLVGVFMTLGVAATIGMLLFKFFHFLWVKMGLISG